MTKHQDNLGKRDVEIERHDDLTPQLSDRQIAESLDIQAKLLAEAYSTCDDDKIDQALLTVGDARSRLQNGMFDWIP